MHREQSWRSSMSFLEGPPDGEACLLDAGPGRVQTEAAHCGGGHDAGVAGACLCCCRAWPCFCAMQTYCKHPMSELRISTSHQTKWVVYQAAGMQLEEKRVETMLIGYVMKVIC